MIRTGIAVLIGILSLSSMLVSAQGASLPAIGALAGMTEDGKATLVQLEAFQEGAGSMCDRAIPRNEAQIPEFNAPDWQLKDSGRFQFQYNFYSRKGSDKVAAMTVEGLRAPGVPTKKVTWEIGDEVYSVRFGPEAGQEPVCVRKIRANFDLDGLYQRLKPRLQR